MRAESSATAEGGAGITNTLRRRLVSGSAWAFVARILTVVVGLASNAVLTRVLTPAEFGVFVLVLTFVSIGSTLGSLGLPQAATRFIAAAIGRGRPGAAKRVVDRTLAIGSVGALAAGAAFAYAGVPLGARLFHEPMLVGTGTLLGAWIASHAVQRLVGESFRGLHDVRTASLFGTTNLGLATQTLLLAAVGAVALANGSLTLHRVLILALTASASTAVVGAASLLAKMRGAVSRAGEAEGSGSAEALPPSGGPAPSHASTSASAPPSSRLLLGVSLPLLANGLTSFLLTQADVWILSAVAASGEVAIYGSAVRLVTLVTIPLLVVNAVVPPIIAELHATERLAELEDVLRSATTIAAVPAVVLLAFLALFGGPILGTVFGDFYRQAAPVLVILSLGQLSNVWTGSCGLALIMTGNEKPMMIITTSLSLLAIAGGYLVAQRTGAVGLSAVMAASVLLQNLLKLVAARRLVGIWTHVTFSARRIRRVARA